MKELSIKEKAEAYDLALERAKKWCNAPNIDKMPTYGNRIIEEIFPELKESGDERIRKFLHYTFTVQYLAKDGLGKWHGEPVSNILAWIEKQGEQTNFLPKIQVGDIFTRNEGGELIKISQLNMVAKKHKNQSGPNLIMAKSPQLGEQKPAWSEEDERIYYSLLADIRTRQDGSTSTLEAYYNEQIDWLKSLKDRVLSQPKQEENKGNLGGISSNWSEEDALRLEEVICMIEANGRWVRSDDAVKSVLDWLKSLEDRYTWKPSEKQMEALKDACDEHWEPDGLDPLYTLYQELKKLREE